jgi:lipopolysaccharide transport system permease protein
MVEPGHMQRNFWKKAWRFRELFFIMAWRDLSVRYKQTVLGVGWAILKPLLTMGVLTVIFGKFAKFPAPGVTPYAVLVFAGLLPWNLFAYLVGESSSSLLVNANMISKVYFPRIILPAATVLVALVDFMLSFVMLLLLMVALDCLPDWRIIFLPFFIVLVLVYGLGPGLLFAALNVKFRDLRNILPFLLQLGLYVSPVGFSDSVVPERWYLLYSLNPIVGIIDGFRWCLLHGQGGLDWRSVAMSVTVSALMLWIGLWRFRYAERTFADLI